MNEWLNEAKAAIQMSYKNTVTVDTEAMQVTARVDQFSGSGMFWVDGRVDVHQSGLMRPLLPPGTSGPQIFIPYTLEGEGRVVVPDLGKGTYDSSVQPKALRLVPDSILYDFSGPTLNKSFVPFVAVSTLADWFGGRVPKALRPFLADRIDESLSVPLQNPSLLRMMVAQVYAYEEPLRGLALQSLAMQMVTQFASELCGADAQYASLSVREVAATKEAHERLVLNLGAPPSTSELAETAGMTEKRLDYAFREIYGMSIFRALTNARLDHAYEALVKAQMPVKELSFRLGYKHASSFSRAFYQRFGVYPAQLAKH